MAELFKLKPCTLILIKIHTIQSCHQAIARKFHVYEAFICKAFKGTAVVDYCKPLITQQMSASNSPAG